MEDYEGFSKRYRKIYLTGKCKKKKRKAVKLSEIVSDCAWEVMRINEILKEEYDGEE